MSAGKTGGIIAVLAVVGSIGYIGAQGYVNNGVAKDSVREIADKIEKQANNGLQIEFEKADAPIFGNSIAASGVSLLNANDDVVFEIDSVKMSADGYVKDEAFPTSATFDIENVKAVSKRVKQSLNPYLAENYADTAMSATFGYSFDQEADVISGNITVSFPELSEVSVSMSLSDVADIWDIMEENYAENEGKIDLERSQQREVKRLFQGVKLASLNGTYTNKGEIEAFLKFFSEEKNVSEDRVKEEMLKVIDMYTGELSFNSELNTFVEDPKSLSVTFAPEKPMTFQEISTLAMVSAMGKGDDELADAGLEVKANQ